MTDRELEELVEAVARARAAEEQDREPHPARSGRVDTCGWAADGRQVSEIPQHVPDDRRCEMTVQRRYTASDGSKWIISRGGYVGTTDDRADRWYIDRAEADAWDRRGCGYKTLADAQAAIERAVAP